MNDLTNSQLETMVIDKTAPGNKYTHEEKIKHLDDAIRNGGYYGDDGVWNAIKIFDGDNHIYRARVETLIIKDKKSIFLKFISKKNDHNKRIYLVPGGSIERDISNIDQAYNECKEEARILVKNIQSSGITYKEVTTPPNWAIAKQAVNWNGNFTEIYVAEYDKPYDGYIDKVDVDKFMASGKFYDLDKVFPYLKKEHRLALKHLYPARFTEKSVITENKQSLSRNDKEQLLDQAIRVLEDEGFHPKVSTASRNAFLNNTTHIVSNGSSICISGFKQKELRNAVELLQKNISMPGVQFYPDNYGTLFISLGDDVLSENALTTKERNSLDDSQFGIPSLRKFPLHDKAHVLYAIRLFNTVDRKHEKELAHNLLKAMDMYEIDRSLVGERNRLISYIYNDI